MATTAQQVFLNLPISNLQKSIVFYTALGFKQNMQFSDETAACMMLSESFGIMILTHEKWKQFTQKEIPNAHKTAPLFLAITCESKEAVNTFVQCGIKAGGRSETSEVKDYGFMYQCTLEDPDGHILEPFWMQIPE